MLVIVVILAAFEPEHEQITPSLYDEPVALLVAAVLVVALPLEVALLHALTAIAMTPSSAAAHRVGLMACLLVSNSQWSKEQRQRRAPTATAIRRPPATAAPGA
jgi:hypothetical protein